MIQRSQHLLNKIDYLFDSVEMCTFCTGFNL